MFGNRRGGRFLEIDRRLRGDAALARRSAPAAVHGRTIAAIAGLAPEPAPGPPAAGSSVALMPSYAAAFVAVAIIGVVAIALLAPKAGPPVVAASGGAASAAPAVSAPRPGRAVIEVDATRLTAAVDRHADRFDSPLEAALIAQVRLVLGDAGRATDLVLARLPMRPVRMRGGNATKRAVSPSLDGEKGG